MEKGTEKQVAWASKIAADWTGQLDREIENVAARIAGGNGGAAIDDYAARLAAARDTFLAGIEKLPAAQIIGLYQAGRNPAALAIDKARAAS